MSILSRSRPQLIIARLPRTPSRLPRTSVRLPLSSVPLPSVRRYRRGLTAARLGSRVVWRATRLGARAGEGRVRLAQKPTAVTPIAAKASAAIGGATAMFFLDPHAGRRRRHVARDRLLKLLRRGEREAERKLRYASGAAAGTVHEVTHAAQPPKEPADDATLAHRVETEIFRDPNAPKGTVNVNVENGVVFLRGYVDSQSWIDRLVAHAESVEGVLGVRNLLHVQATAGINVGAIAGDGSNTQSRPVTETG